VEVLYRVFFTLILPLSVTLVDYLDEKSTAQNGATTQSFLTDCRDTGCPDSEECRQEIVGSVRYACVCSDGFERDSNTKHCQLISQSGQSICC